MYYKFSLLAEIFSQCRIQVLFEEISSSITLEDIKKKLTRPSTYSSSLRFTGKGITTGKVEGAVEVYLPLFIYIKP